MDSSESYATLRRESQKPKQKITSLDTPTLDAPCRQAGGLY